MPYMLAYPILPMTPTSRHHDCNNMSSRSTIGLVATGSGLVPEPVSPECLECLDALNYTMWALCGHMAYTYCLVIYRAFAGINHRVSSTTQQSNATNAISCLTMSESVPRKRSRAACTSCQTRKRKCSGDQPCVNCLQFGSDCHFDLDARKKKDVKRLHTPSSLQSAMPMSVNSVAGNDVRTRSRSPTDPNMHLSSLEANSGAAFVRRLGLKIDPANAPRLSLFAWNIGRRQSPSASPPATIPVPVVDIISQNEMRALTMTFYEKVDPCYGFVERDTLLRQIGRRWLPPSAEAALRYGPYDAVLCGVAAFASLFAQREATATEIQLVESARLILEQSLLSEAPSIDTVTGWILRVSYLRTTSTLHAAWLSSCTLMHLVEATGLHLELPSDTVLLRSPESCNPETRRRLFALARHLNIWLSFELGRSRVVLHGATTLPPTPRTNNHKEEIFDLLPLTESLDPNKAQDATDLEAALTDVLRVAHVQPPLILAQCNLMLCIYRRLRALNSTISGPLLAKLLGLAGRGIRAAREMVAQNCPWHQAANVPFQVLCTLLAIDSRASLGLLPEAMQTLRQVASAYDTEVMREAYSTAYLLILLHQRRKEEETRTLGDVLRSNPAASAGRRPDPSISAPATAPATAHTPEVAGTQQQQSPAEETNLQPQQQGPQYDLLSDSAEELAWLDNLVIDMPSLQNFDLESFLTMNLPWPLPETGI